MHLKYKLHLNINAIINAFNTVFRKVFVNKMSCKKILTYVIFLKNRRDGEGSYLKSDI